MGYKIFTHEIHSSYAARIDNFRSYDTISKDIIQRWTYPFVPDVMFSENSGTKLERHGMYRASGKKQKIVKDIRCLVGEWKTVMDIDFINSLLFRNMAITICPDWSVYSHWKWHKNRG